MPPYGVTRPQWVKSKKSAQWLGAEQAATGYSRYIALLGAMSAKLAKWVAKKWGPTCDRNISDSAIYTTAIYGENMVQSTPVISRLLGAKIRERELSGSPVISRCRAKATTQCHRPTLPGVYNSQTVCWAIIEVLTFPGSLHTSTSHQRQITTSNIRF